MMRPSEGREVLGFLAGALSGPVLLAIVLGLASGFSTNSLKIALGALFFAVGPATLLFGMPTYYAIRKVRIPGPWWTVAFGAAISTVLPVLFGALRVGFPPNVTDQAWALIVAVISVGAALCGAVGGLVFWVLVFKNVAKAGAA